jgi:hypothetical protein
MTKTKKAPWFVNVGNVLTMTLLRAGFKLVGPGNYPMYLLTESSFEEFERAACRHPVFLLQSAV